MTAPTLRIPESVADDPSDVADALEVASALWGKGQSEEAIRWLRRAVAAASEADDAVRAAGLAGAAADLEDALKQQSPAAPIPPDSHAPANSAAAPLPAPLAARTGEPSAEPSAVAAEPPSPATAAPAAAGAPLERAHESHDATEPTVPDSPAAISVLANGSSPSTMPAAPAMGAPPSIGAPPASMRPAPASMPPRASSVPAPRSAFAKPPIIHPTHSPTALPDLPPRMRVSVKTSVRDAGLLFVRALAEGEETPPGTLEAFLVREATEGNGDAQSQETGTPEGSAP